MPRAVTAAHWVAATAAPPIDDSAGTFQPGGITPAEIPVESGNQPSASSDPFTSHCISDEQWAEIARQVNASGGGYREDVFARLLKDLLPPIRTSGQQWYLFNGTHWERSSGSDRLLPVAMRLLTHFNLATAKRGKDLLAHIGSTSQASSKWYGAYRFDPEMRVLLNVQNGILRVSRSGVVMLPHDPGYGFTQAIPTKWDADADCGEFKKALSECLPDEEDRNLFRLFAGSILEPSSRLEAALACFGSSGTGKSTLINDGIAEAVGGQGAGTVTRTSLRQLCDPKSYSLPKLEFSIMNIITEGDALEVEESSNFKVLVSGEPVECREIYGAPRTIATTTKIIMATNTLPRFRNGTDAEMRRMRFVRFNQLPAHPDPDLKSRIRAECQGILRWMVEALQDVLSLGAMPSGGAASREVVERFAVTNDSLGCFIASECVLDPSGFVPKEQLLKAFNAFAANHGLATDNAVWFARKLLSQYPQLKSGKRDGRQSFLGIALKHGDGEG